MKKLLLLLCLGLPLLVLPLRAQNEAFEVASVKPSNPNPTGGPLGAIPMVLPVLDRLTAQNTTLRMLVISAYQKQPYEVIGGPEWQNTDKFDINARAAGAKTQDQLLGMLQTLLADRFKLRVHIEQREVPIYALVVARNDGRLGPKMKPSTDTCPDIKEQQQKALESFAKGGITALAAAAAQAGQDAPCSISGFQPSTPGAIGLRARGQQIATLTMLLTQMVGRPVVDKTGLSGAYDFEVALDMRSLLRMAAELGVTVPGIEAALAKLPEGPSLMTVIQEDLGLKLDSQRGPGDVLVIDSAERPTPD